MTMTTEDRDPGSPLVAIAALAVAFAMGFLCGMMIAAA